MQKKIDANQPEIVAALRRCGATVDIVSSLPGLGYDLVVDYHGSVYKVEIKDGSKPPSAQKLTDSEIRAQINSSRGTYHVVNSVDQALAMINQRG